MKKSKTKTTPAITPEYADTKTMAALLGVSTETLKTWRLGRKGQPPRLVEGAHWVSLGNATRYHLELMRDFFVNQHRPDLHQRTVERFLAGVLSSR